MQHRLVLIIVAVLLGAAPVINALAQDVVPAPEVRSTGKLTIANTLNYAPFEFIGADGKPAGIIVELATAVAELVHADLDLQRMPFPSLMPGLAAGRFKIAWETFSVSPERLQQVDFLIFLKAGLAVSTRPDLVDQFSGDLPLCGKSVGVSVGSASDSLVDTLSDQCVAAGKAAIQKSVFNSAPDILQAVLSDRIQARIDDATASSYFEATTHGQLVVLPTHYQTAPLGLAIAKHDPDTEQMLLSALSVLFNNGTYAATLEKYGMSAYAIAEPYFVDDMDDLRKE